MGSGRGAVPAADLGHIGSLFEIAGEFRSGCPLGRGHIHETFVTTWEHSGRVRRYVHQRINTAVFPDTKRLESNVARVAEHLRRKLAHLGEDELARHVLTPVPARAGGLVARADDGGWWRTTIFIPDSLTLESVGEPQHAFEAAKAFGSFVALLSDLPGPRLPETIPGFHDTPQRLAALAAVVRCDPLGRAAGAKEEIDFATAREDLADALSMAQRQGVLPERVVHNDSKINNVLFDEASGEALCVIDLDTVMPGTALHDFGDLVRSAVAAAAEDEHDLARVEVRLPIFEALVRGYCAGTAGCLVPAEIERLVTASQVITLECGMRFLADHLDGDRYFPAQRPMHNLDRARTQFGLLRSLEEAKPVLDGIVGDAASPSSDRRKPQ